MGVAGSRGRVSPPAASSEPGRTAVDHPDAKPMNPAYAGRAGYIEAMCENKPSGTDTAADWQRREPPKYRFRREFQDRPLPTEAPKHPSNFRAASPGESASHRALPGYSG